MPLALVRLSNEARSDDVRDLAETVEWEFWREGEAAVLITEWQERFEMERWEPSSPRPK
jgi:hypothetical protein